MKHISKKAAALIFIIVVAISGFALAANGNLDNPFQVITQLTANTSGQGERTGPPSGEMGEPPAGMGERGEQSDSFNWNAVTSLFSPLWFIMAASAVVMVIGRPIGLIIKKLQHLRPIPRPAAA